MYRTLKAYTVNDNTWTKIFEQWGDWIITVDDLSPYTQGYKEKNKIYFDGDKTLVIRESCVLYSADISLKGINSWKQCIVRKDDEQKLAVQNDIAGLQAYYREKELILKYYTEIEYEECLASHTAEYIENKAQVHLWLDIPQFSIETFRDCYKYDINGAHNEALCEIFPKAAKALKKQFDERKEKPNNKKYVNYYVGCLAKLGYRETYNWIVQHTTQKLLSAIDEVDGIILYANTDGFIVWDYKNILETSKELGDFKEEYHGDVRLYKDKNYIIFQYKDGDEVVTKGSCLCSVRDMIDLEKGTVVHYDRVKKNNCYYATNITTENIEN